MNRHTPGTCHGLTDREDEPVSDNDREPEKHDRPDDGRRDDAEAWRREVEERLRRERGDDWVERNRALLDAQWEFLKDSFF